MLATLLARTDSRASGLKSFEPELCLDSNPSGGNVAWPSGGAGVLDFQGLQPPQEAQKI